VEKRSVETIIRALNAANVRYLIAGGLAVVAHGYVRFTADIDLILDLESANVTNAMTAFKDLRYRPRAPVSLDEFADPARRAEWVREKGLTVFSLYSSEHPATEIDLFVELPVDFNRAYEAAARMEVAPGAAATLVSFEDLLRLKQKAGRPQDLLDIEKLKALQSNRTDDSTR
jgi:hypothetical protein